MIASIATASRLLLLTTSPADFSELESVVIVAGHGVPSVAWASTACFTARLRQGRPLVGVLIHRTAGSRRPAAGSLCGATAASALRCWIGAAVAPAYVLSVKQRIALGP